MIFFTEIDDGGGEFGCSLDAGCAATADSDRNWASGLFVIEFVEKLVEVAVDGEGVVDVFETEGMLLKSWDVVVVFGRT